MTPLDLVEKSGFRTSATSTNIPEHQTGENRLFLGLMISPDPDGGGDPGLGCRMVNARAELMLASGQY
jgi:hypothetical protein